MPAAFRPRRGTSRPYGSTGSEAPVDPFVAARYRGRWFWIDSGDFRSKGSFSFMLLLTSLAETGVAQQAPVVTVPAN